MKSGKTMVAFSFAAVMAVCFLAATVFCFREMRQVSALRASGAAQTAAQVAALNRRIADLEKTASTQSTASQLVSPPGTAELKRLGDENALLTQRLQEKDIDLAAEETAMMCSQAAFTKAHLGEMTRYLVPPANKYVYLTFDDGPSKNTPGVLETLRQNGVKATFFVVYNPNPDYYRQIAAAGQEIALHSYTHEYKKIYSSDQAFYADLTMISDYVTGITGIESKIMRFAGGSSNTVSRHYSQGIMTRLDASLTQKGYVYFDWNAECMDATTGGVSKEQVLSNVESFTQVSGRDKPFIILLLHNSATQKTTADALQSVIDYYRAKGYLFEQLQTTTPAVHQPLQN